MLQNPVFRCFVGLVIGCLLVLAVTRLARWRHARSVARRWRGTACLLALLIPLALLAGGGCASPNLKDLGDDHAAVQMTIVTPWGTQKISRINPATNQSATVTTDGSVTITSK